MCEVMAIPLISTSRITLTLNIRGKDPERDEKITCGFHLTKSKWDPYPWVGYVERGSIADVAGLKTGDCLLQIDQVDVVGLRVKEIASLVKKESSGSSINLQIWRSEEYINTEQKLDGRESGAALAGPLPILMKKFLRAVSKIVDILECPVCLDTATPPISQCVHGHILCAPCRSKTLRCPVCRVRLGQGRCLLADEIQRNIRESFDGDGDRGIMVNTVTEQSNRSLKHKLFGIIPSKSYAETESQQIKKYKTPFFRLFRGGFDRAVSADNLTRDFENSSSEKERCTGNNTRVAFKRLGELTRGDRAKSASTGELSSNERDSINARKTGNLTSSQSGNFLSIPVTPSWGGSMDSISANNLFLCPLFMQTDCRESLTNDRLAEHLGNVHNYNSQMHFYGDRATISLVTLSSQSYVVHIFHHADQLFIFQYENGKAWMIGTGVTAMTWILHWTQNKIKLKLERQVLKINDNSQQQLSSQQAHLPNDHSIDVVHVEITSSLQSDGLL